MRTKYTIDEAAKDAVKTTFHDVLTIPQAAWAMGRSVPEVQAIVKCLFREKAIIPVGKIHCNIAGRSEMRYTTNEQAAWTRLFCASLPAWIGIGYKKQEMLMAAVKAYVEKRFVESGFTIPPEIAKVWPKVKGLVDAEIAEVWAQVEDLNEKEAAE